MKSSVKDAGGRDLQKEKVPGGGIIRVKPGEKVRKGQLLVAGTPPNADSRGAVRSSPVHIEIGKTIPMSEMVKADRKTELIVIEHTGEMHPQILVEDADGKILDFHHLPVKALIEVTEGQEILQGQMLARQPKDVAGSADIVGGLPRESPRSSRLESPRIQPSCRPSPDASNCMTISARAR